MCFVEIDIDAIIKEECKDPEFKREYEKVKERYSKKNIDKKRYRAIDRVRMMKKQEGRNGKDE